MSALPTFAILLMSLVFSPLSFALDAPAIKNLFAEPHSRDGLLPQLQIYPDARKYLISVKSGKFIDELEFSFAAKVEEKTVQGKFIVSRLIHPGVENLLQVSTYDTKNGVHRRWTLFPDGFISEMTGVADMLNRTIAWASTKGRDEKSMLYICVEEHSDTGSKWNDRTLVEGRVTAVSQGTAKRTK